MASSASVSASASSSSSTALNEANLEKRLVNVTNTQDSIQTLSLWCLHHKAHFAKIVQIWTKVFKSAKMNHRLALFYLANDVIQNSKRKGFLHFGEAWMPSIKESIPLVTEDKIKAQMDRILTIWEERSVYDTPFINELRSLFVNVQPDEPADVKVLADFKPHRLVDKIKKFKKLEADIELKHKQFTSLKLDVCSTETLKQLKDKAHGTKFTKDFEDATAKLDEFVQILQRRAKDRKALIDMLEESSVFYDTQRKEAKIVANAYKNFGSRVKNLQGKLDEMLPDLSSPVPSPPFDAPSPENSSAEGSPTRIGSKDNTEAIDMEMSDDELGANTVLQDKDEVSSLSSAPSPDGSPVGLSTSPPPSFVPAVSKSLTSHSKATAKSLLESLRKTTAASTNTASSSTTKTTASSLDIRLSNLMHSIPNFATSLFGGHPLVDAIKLPPTTAATVPQDGCATPLKDEESCAGSATPLQDENRETKFNAKTPSETVPPSSIIDNLLHKLTSASATAQPPKHHQPQIASDVPMESKPKYSGVQDIVLPLEMPPSFCDFLTPAMLRAMEAKSMLDGSRASSGSSGKSSLAFAHLFPPANGDDQDISASLYRRNSNIVQLTPSPRASPKFDAKPEQASWMVENQRAVPMVKIAGSEAPVEAVSPMRPLGDGVFFPNKLNPPKKSTITINLRTAKAAGSPAVKSELATPLTPPTPGLLAAPNISNLRTISLGCGDAGAAAGHDGSQDMSGESAVPPILYSKIETLDSSRDSHDFWAQGAGGPLAPAMRPGGMPPAWSRQQQPQEGPHGMEYQRPPPPRQQLLPQGPPPQQRHPRPYDAGGGRGRGGFAPNWQAGMRNPHWRNPGGPLPKRPMLMPNVPPARWNYYHPQY